MWAWKDAETLALFKLVEDFKNMAKPLKEAFFAYAMQTNRKPDSVRNYYYKTLKEIELNKKNRLKINLKVHKINRPEAFSKEEEKAVFEKIQKLLSEGCSLRNACLKVAGGDIKKMLRYQNKFRSLEKSAEPCKVVRMPSKKGKLTDSEINSLFMGLVKLIKKCAEEQAEEKALFEAETANEALRRTVVELSAKQKELDNLKKNFEILKNQKLLLKEELNGLRSQTASLFSRKMKGEKLSSLKSFMNKLDKISSVENEIK